MSESDFFVDGIWVRDTQMYQKCQWNQDIKADKGVVIGVDDNQEWMLKWWWDRYREHNDYPVLFADFGMSKLHKNWCEERGYVSSLITLEGHPWFRKPFGCLASCFKQSIWLDTDVEVRRNIEPLFSYAENNHIGATFDRGSPKQWAEALPCDARLYNSGIIAYNHGDIIFNKWALMVMIMCPFEPVKGKLKIPTGDQEVLALAIRQYGKDRVREMPKEQVRLRREPDRILYGNCVVKHWTGPHGKEEIKKRVPSFTINQRKHILDKLPDNGRLLQWGCNGDTIWFAERLKPSQKMIAVYRSKDEKKVENTLKECGLSDRIKLIPDDESFSDLSLELFEVFLVDQESLFACIHRAQPGAWIFTKTPERLAGARKGYGNMV
jgi:hypothetical protein